MVSTYVPLFMLFLAGGLLTLVFFFVTPLLGKRNPTPEKMLPYECGSEAVFIYPWAIQFRSLGAAGLLTMFGFVATLALALAYCWKKGALEWEK